MTILSKLSPWSALADLQQEMDQLMGSVFGGNSLEGGPRATRQAARAWAPAVDVFSRGGDLVVRAELPGVDPEKDVEISVSDGVLHIRGERRTEQRHEDTNYFRMETSYGAFERSIPLPDGIDIDGIKAVHEKGILEVVVPVSAQVAQARKIPVQIQGTGEAQPSIESGASSSNGAPVEGGNSPPAT
jgi:HSP20 family protein